MRLLSYLHWRMHLRSFTRCAQLSYALHVSMQIRNPLISDNGEVYIRCILFFGMLLPIGTSPAPVPEGTELLVSILIMHLCLFLSRTRPLRLTYPLARTCTCICT
jgi:hypothetical protein